LARGLVATRRPNTVREILSVEEAARLLEAAPGIKYKAALGVAYGTGLRVSEVAHLKVDDIDSQRMLIRVEQGKGGRDRNAMLSPQLLELLRMWWREGKRRGVMFPHGWLFPGAATPTRSLRANCTAPCRRLPKSPGSSGASARTPCATALPPICLSRTSISA
jgi:integrase